MGRAVRQFKALTKKNFISWARQPCCAVFQLICPGMLMLLLVWARRRIAKVDPVVFQPDYEMLKKPFFPALEYLGDSAWATNQFTKTSQRQSNFFLYDNYTSNAYNVTTDKTGPLAFLPPACTKEASVIRPRTASWVIAVVGESNPIQDAVTSYLKTLNQLQMSKDKSVSAYNFKYFDNQTALFDYIKHPDYFNISRGYEGVCFGYQVVSKAANSYDVQMYFNDQVEMSRRRPDAVGIPSQYDPSWDASTSRPKLTEFKQYTNNGYSMLHNLIANLVLKKVTGNNDATISLMTVPQDAEDKPLDRFSQVLADVLPRLILFMYILPVFTVVSLLVKEKESKTRESMRMMGMTDTPYWLSWFVYYTVLNTILTLIAWGVLCINVIAWSNKLWVLIWIWLYGQAIFGEVVFMQALFSKAKFSGLISAIVYFILVIINIPLNKDDTPKIRRLVPSIIPQVALQQTCKVLAGFESTRVGIHNDTVDKWYFNYQYQEGLIMLAIALPFWTFLGLYLDKVLPREYGKKESCCFYCSPSFWGCCRKKARNLSEIRNAADNYEARNLDSEYYEPVASDIAKLELEDKFLQIKDLRKTYENGFKAVNGINVKMYQGQIFALLGQNGAGKTTTISMLTGLLPPSDGSASVYEHNVFDEMQSVREFMGICPQHDVLFELLTPLEHLDLFYELKNGDPSKKQAEIDQLVVEVGLSIDKDKQAGTLSGGNKRKLSVSIAIIGQSKLVLLDEPTSGMDLGARRGLWNMLRKYRRDRIIILTTHYMDEADVLGDRIGIMANGKLKCLGSSLFLKNKFGGGYKLVMVKKGKSKNLLVQPFIEQYFGSVELLSEISSEITFTIPKEKRNVFQEFFKAFDEKMDELEIESYGISISTVEEVFLAVNAENRKELQEEQPVKELPFMPTIQQVVTEDQQQLKVETKNTPNKQNQVLSELAVNKEENLTKGSDILTNNYALLIKRAHVYRRDYLGLLCEILCPFIMVLIGCGLAQIQWIRASSPRPLVPDQYPLPQRIAMNRFNVVPPTKAGQQPGLFFANLPNATNAFDLTYLDQTDYYGFYDAVIDEQHKGQKEPYRYGAYQIYQADGLKHNYQVNAQLNLTSADVAALYPQFIYESILKTATNDSNFQFKVTTQPFPSFWVFVQRAEGGDAISYTFFLSVGLALIPTVIISFILKEREENLKHMQLISGMNIAGYWVSNAIADIIKTYIPMLLILLISKLFKLNFEGCWVMYLLYPWAIVMFSYVFSFFFSSDSSAQIAIFAINFLVGGVMSIVVFALQIIPETENLGNFLRWLFCLVPSYSVTHAIIFASSKELILQAQPEMNSKLWAGTNLGGDAACLSAWFVFGVIFLILVETDWLQGIRKWSFRPIPPPKEDLALENDVLAEEQRVKKITSAVDSDDPEKKQDSQADVIKVVNFRKAYTKLFGKPFLAVERISFGLNFGECFALLGVNGAGKSTTFKGLTGDVLPTTGSITIQGFDIQRDFKSARKLIGYCPQKDAIFPLLNVEEHLWFYSRIKGIPKSLREQLVEKAIIEMNLAEHRKKTAGTLSGGNKRKLAVAIATLGNPPIILLDEPSAGMDPEARRFMWTVVERISQRDKKSAVILTTHSMEEAEALSTKMGIMVRGGIFRCFGSSQHIKNKYGTGYEIQLKIRKTNYRDLDDIRNLCKFGNDEIQILLSAAVSKAKNARFSNLILDEIKEGSIGADLATEATANNGIVLIENFVQYLFVQQNGIRIITQLAKIFSSVEILEQCADFYKLKVPRGSTTIGFLFGMLEDKRTELNISEYSVTQTSLEQIFQQFANMEVAETKASLAFGMKFGKCVKLDKPSDRQQQTPPSPGRNTDVQIDFKARLQQVDDVLVLKPDFEDIVQPKIQ